MKKLIFNNYLSFFNCQCVSIRFKIFGNKQSTFSCRGIRTKISLVGRRIKKKIENLISKFSDDSLKQIWSGNLILYALTANGFGNQPSRGHCLIAKTIFQNLKMTTLIALWKMGIILLTGVFSISGKYL